MKIYPLIHHPHPQHARSLSRIEKAQQHAYYQQLDAHNKPRLPKSNRTVRKRL